MFNLATSRGQLVRGDKSERIKQWAVWFQTPFGMCETLEEAQKILASRDIDPDMAIIPKVVAISDTMNEVWGR